MIRVNKNNRNNIINNLMQSIKDLCTMSLSIKKNFKEYNSTF